MILIVEDDLDLAEMLNAYFRVQGYGVMTAMWGNDAVRICRETPPDLVMLDIRLPDIDGYEVCRQLRSHRRTATLPVIFLTERRERVDKLQGLQLGVVDYVTKPFDIQELRLRTRNALLRGQTGAMVNPVTNLPDGALVDDHLTWVITHDEDWVAVGIGLKHLDRFRETYGFVAADDVLRAVSLMVVNTVNELAPGEFVGHLGNDELLVMTHAPMVARLVAQLSERLGPSMEYFYPLKDRGDERENHRLDVRLGTVAPTGANGDAGGLRTRLYRALQ